MAKEHPPEERSVLFLPDEDRALQTIKLLYKDASDSGKVLPQVLFLQLFPDTLP